MRRKKLFRAGGIASLLLFSFAGKAQVFTTTALLERVKMTGIYRIVLPPPFVAYCKADLADVRIYGRDGEQIPYVLNTDPKSPLNTGYFTLPEPVFRQKDSSNKHSYVHLSFSEAYRIDRLSLTVSGPVLFKRTVEVYDEDCSCPWKAGSIFTVDPQDSVFNVPPVKTRHLMLDISNLDNAPLKLSRVGASQSGVYLLAQLEESKEYVVKGGDSTAVKPEYDLHFFTDSMQSKPLDAVIKEIRSGNAAPPVVVQPHVEKKGSPFLLWSVLTLVLLLLIYISVKMVRAIAKKEADDRL